MSDELLQPTDDEIGKMLRGYFRSRMPVFPPSSEIVGELATIALPSRPPVLNRSRWAMALGVASVVGVIALVATTSGRHLTMNIKEARVSSAHKTAFPALKPPLNTAKT